MPTLQHGFGPPVDAPRLEDVETLRIGPAEVLVRVAAAAVRYPHEGHPGKVVLVPEVV